MSSRFMRRLRAFFLRADLDRELDQEIRFHLERQIELNVSGGMSPAEARYAALRSFNGVEQAKELCREARGVRLFEDLGQDLRSGFRMVRNNVGFTLVAVLSIGLGIGLVSTAFSFQLFSPLRGETVELRLSVVFRRTPLRRDQFTLLQPMQGRIQ